MHLVNILRIITFSFLVGHSILTISDFNGFRFFWDTLYINAGFLALHDQLPWLARHCIKLLVDDIFLPPRTKNQLMIKQAS